MRHIRDKRGAPYLSCGFPLKTQQDLEDREKEALRAPLDECFFGMKRMCSAEFSIFIVVLHLATGSAHATEIDSKLRQHSRCTNNQHWLHVYIYIYMSIHGTFRQERRASHEDWTDAPWNERNAVFPTHHLPWISNSFQSTRQDAPTQHGEHNSHEQRTHRWRALHYTAP